MEGESVFFDSNGDSPARYELVSLQPAQSGTMKAVTIGIYDASLPASQQFMRHNTTVVWGGGVTKVNLTFLSGMNTVMCYLLESNILLIKK